MSKLPDANPTLTAYLVRQRRQAERQANSSAFNRSGTSVTAEGVTEVEGELDVTGALVVTGTETVNGPLAVHGTAAFDGATTIGGTLGVTGPTTLGAPTTVSGSLGVSGPMTVSGTLSLPAGIIDNAALANQVTAGVASAVTQTGWATTTSMASKASTTVTTPAGFTSALVTALGMVVFQDTTANRFDCQCVIEGTQGPTIISLANLTGSASPSQTRVVPVTGGQVLNIDVQVLSVVATGGMAANQAVITASVVFLR